MLSKQFLQQVTSYIRSKEARSYVEKELQQHLEQAKLAWIKKGYSPEEAEQKAVVEMGSASNLGKSMDKIHRPKWDFWLIGAVIGLLIASFIPIMTMGITPQFGTDMTSIFVRNKVIYIAIAIAITLCAMFFDYRKLQRYSLSIYIVGVVSLFLMVFAPNTTVNGEAMLMIGPITIKAWTILPLLLVAFSSFFSNPNWKLWVLVLLFIIPLCCFMMLPNLPVIMLYCVCIAVLFGCSVYDKTKKISVFSSVAIINLLLLSYVLYAYESLLKSYQTIRIQAFLHPEQYADTDGYMLLQLKDVLSHAGWFGAESKRYIPEGHTDYALVQLIQSYGYATGLVVIILLLLISFRILWMTHTMPRSFGKLVLIGAVTLYSSQSIYSILMVFGILPLTSIPLPFISYGATPLLLNALLIGLVLSVYRRKSYIIQQISNRLTK